MDWSKIFRPGGSQGHLSCDKRLRTIEERLEAIELRSAEQYMEVLNVAEKVAERLKDRTQKRKKQADDPDRPLTPQEKGAILRQRGGALELLSG